MRPATLAAATFFVSRTIAKEKIGEPVRRRFDGSYLVTCTRCLGPWVALGVLGLERVSPTAVRALALAGANAWLQAGFTGLCNAANALEHPRDFNGGPDWPGKGRW